MSKPVPQDETKMIPCMVRRETDCCTYVDLTTDRPKERLRTVLTVESCARWIPHDAVVCGRKRRNIQERRVRKEHGGSKDATPMSTIISKHVFLTRATHLMIVNRRHVVAVYSRERRGGSLWILVGISESVTQ
jgi:hypothetical protein